MRGFDNVKKATKLKIIGFLILGVGAILIISGIVVGRDDFFGMPEMSFLVPGIFIAFISLFILLSGFSPEIAKFSSELDKEIHAHAGQEIYEATKKRADTVVPAITPAIKEAVKEIKDKKTLEELLNEAKILFDKGVVTKDEYEQMRKNILGI